MQADWNRALPHHAKPTKTFTLLTPGGDISTLPHKQYSLLNNELRLISKMQNRLLVHAGCFVLIYEQTMICLHYSYLLTQNARFQNINLLV